MDAAGHIVDVGGCQPTHGDTARLEQVDVLLPGLRLMIEIFSLLLSYIHRFDFY